MIHVVLALTESCKENQTVNSHFRILTSQLRDLIYYCVVCLLILKKKPEKGSSAELNFLAATLAKNFITEHPHKDRTGKYVWIIIPHFNIIVGILYCESFNAFFFFILENVTRYNGSCLFRVFFLYQNTSLIFISILPSSTH